MGRALAAIEHEKPREAFVLHYVEELSVPETVVACAAPEGTVKGWLRDARHQFETAVTRLGFVAGASSREAGVMPLLGALSLVESERPLPSGDAARVWARIEASPEYRRLACLRERTGNGGDRGIASAPRPGVPRWAVAVLTLGALAIGASWRRAREAPRAPITATPDALAAPPSPPPVQAPVSPLAPPSPAALPGTPPTPPRGAGGIDAEVALMHKANAAIASGDTAGALAIVAEHAREFPGHHPGWREQTRMRALLQGGQVAAPAP